MATFESVIANVRNMPERAAAALQSLRQENKDHLSSNLILESLRGPLHYKTKWEHGATEFDHFDTLVPCAAGAVIGSAIGTDLDLYANTSSQNEAGMIVYHDDCPMWSIPTPGSVGGSFRWALVALEWGLGGTSGFQSVYSATPNQTSYGPMKSLAVNYKPLHGLTTLAGGSITCHMRVRPIVQAGAFGAGTVIPWPGADLHAISSAACTLIGKLDLFNPTTFGPLQIKALASVNGKRGGPGLKAAISQVLGDGKFSQLVSSAAGLVSGRRPDLIE